MDADLKALHRAVSTFLRARREAKRTARALAKAGSGFGPHHWDRMHIHDELSHRADCAQNCLKQAEAEIVTLWEALNYRPEPPTDEPMP